ncbi:MAG: hypothetical protein LUC91_08555, partial [Prevotella sp.]|nr:hypothetical protein [Prevotella sp.]
MSSTSSSGAANQSRPTDRGGNTKCSCFQGQRYEIVSNYARIFQKKEKTWVVTAYETERSQKEKGMFDEENETAAIHPITSPGVDGSESIVDTRGLVNEGKDTQKTETAEENTANSSPLNHRSNRRTRQNIIL